MVIMTTVELTTPNGIKYTQPIGLFINGEFVASKNGKKFASESPSTEEKIVDVYEAHEEDAEEAIVAAEKAFPGWSHTDGEHRGLLLYKLADAIEKDTDLIAAIETWDNGKTFSQAKGDVAAVVSTFRNYAGYANKIDGDVIETDEDHFTYVRHEPVGVCGMIIPWNFPLLMFAWKLAPALATGCTLVLKTAESTPLSALYVSSLIKKVGFPAGVANIISGYGPVGGYISKHPRIKKVAFTGSTATGRKILQSVADSNLKKVTLELGGKGANLVLDDADIATAVQGVLVGIFYNSGEVCCAGSRLYLQSGIYDKFLAALKAEVEKIKVGGDPFDPNTFYGAQTNKIQFEKVLDYIKKGSSEGGRIITGGKRATDKGYFVQPTIFADVDHGHTIVKEEIFGPVLSVLKFDTVEEAVQLANDNEYGLSAGVFTENLNRAIWVSNHLQAGTVWVNTFNDLHSNVPFGGFGTSGLGRELGKYALENFTEVKAVRIKGITKGNK